MDYLEKLVKDAFIDNEANSLFLYASTHPECRQDMAQQLADMDEINDYISTRDWKKIKEIRSKRDFKMKMIQISLENESELREKAYNNITEIFLTTDDLRDKIKTELDELKADGNGLNREEESRYRKASQELFRFTKANDEIINLLIVNSKKEGVENTIKTEGIEKTIRTVFGTSERYIAHMKEFFGAVKKAEIIINKIVMTEDYLRTRRGKLIKMKMEEVNDRTNKMNMNYILSRAGEIWEAPAQ